MSEFAKIQHVAWDTMEGETLSAMIERRTVTGDQAQVSLFHLKAGAEVPRHQHENEQLTIVLSGAIRFVYGPADEESRTLRPGEVLVTPPDLPHRVEVLEDTQVIDVFAPPRTDWAAGGDDYLRG